MDTTLRGHDPGRWGHSLANLAEILIPILDAAQVRSIVEIGTYEGDLTRVLLDWAAGSDARVTAVEPDPPARLLRLVLERPELELVRELSHAALRQIELPDAVVIDGDHNYYTVTQELRLIDERSGGNLPLLVLHDVGWPHARRDAYYEPDQIPQEDRQPMVQGAGLVPGEPGVVTGGLPYRWAAEREGGPRNGVLTAVEDFVEARDGLRLAVVPAFFGLGVVWRGEAPWAAAVAEAVAPWDRNPVLARLEANRVLQLATQHVQATQLSWFRERLAAQQRLLRALRDSKAFASADRVSRLRARGRSLPWREQVRRVLGDDDADGQP
jgi:methyltransferase family protein